MEDKKKVVSIVDARKKIPKVQQSLPEIAYNMVLHRINQHGFCEFTFAVPLDDESFSAPVVARVSTSDLLGFYSVVHCKGKSHLYMHRDAAKADDDELMPVNAWMGFVLGDAARLVLGMRAILMRGDPVKQHRVIAAIIASIEQDSPA